MVEQVGRARAPAYQLRLDDILEGNGKLSGVCGMCRHANPVDVQQLLAKHTKHERLVILEDRLRCRNCGAIGKGACSFRVEWPS